MWYIRGRILWIGIFIALLLIASGDYGWAAFVFLLALVLRQGLIDFERRPKSPTKQRARPATSFPATGLEKSTRIASKLGRPTRIASRLEKSTRVASGLEKTTRSELDFQVNFFAKHIEAAMGNIEAMMEVVSTVVDSQKFFADACDDIKAAEVCVTRMRWIWPEGESAYHELDLGLSELQKWVDLLGAWSVHLDKQPDFPSEGFDKWAKKNKNFIYANRRFGATVTQKFSKASETLESLTGLTLPLD